MGRKAKSINIIIQEVVIYINNINTDIFHIQTLAEQIKRPLRRLYDVMLILSGCNYIEYIKSSTYRILGIDGFRHSINIMKDYNLFIIHNKTSKKQTLLHLTHHILYIILNHSKDTQWSIKMMNEHLEELQYPQDTKRLYDVCSALHGVHILCKIGNIYFRNF